MKKYFALCSLLMLAACMPSKQEMATLKPGEVLSVLRMKVKMDNNEETSFKNQCGFMPLDPAGNMLTLRKDKDSSYYLMKSQPGKVTFDRIGCLSNRVFYNKHRIHPLKDVYFMAEAGYINYVGDLEVEWDSDRLNAGDLILSGMGGLSDDEGTIQIGVADRMNEAQQYMSKEYPSLQLPMKMSPLADNPIIAR